MNPLDGLPDRVELAIAFRFQLGTLRKIGVRLVGPAQLVIREATEVKSSWVPRTAFDRLAEIRVSFFVIAREVGVDSFAIQFGQQRILCLCRAYGKNKQQCD